MAASVTSVFTGRIVDILQAVRWEFDQTPGLTISIEEAVRLWPLSRANLTVLFDTFVDVGFLSRLSDGSYRRRVELTTH